MDSCREYEFRSENDEMTLVTHMTHVGGASRPVQGIPYVEIIKDMQDNREYFNIISESMSNIGQQYRQIVTHTPNNVSNVSHVSRITWQHLPLATESAHSAYNQPTSTLSGEQKI
jgi:hypothetical protein